LRALERRFKRVAIRVLSGLSSGRKLDLAEVELDSIRSILLVKQHDQLGDFLLFTPVLPAVRRRFPDARIVLCTRGYTKELVSGDPLLDSIVVIEERLNDWDLKGLSSSLAQLLAGFDLAVIFNTISHSFTSDLIPLLSRATYRLGPVEPYFPGLKANAFYNLEVPVPRDRIHMSDRCLAIVEPLGAPVDDPRERMHVERIWDTEAARVLESWGTGSGELLFAVHPGGARDYTRWPTGKYAALGDELAKTVSAKVILIVGKNETWGEEVARRMVRHPIVCRITNLKLLAAILKRVSVYVGNDTGLLHVASAVGTQSVGIYGKTDPDVWKPKGEHVVSVKAEDGNIASVGIEDVYAAVREMLR
jgi:ADP-heptose:LPS heptosyltransferase